jgi:hypothetical protein
MSHESPAHCGKISIRAGDVQLSMQVEPGRQYESQQEQWIHVRACQAERVGRIDENLHKAELEGRTHRGGIRLDDPPTVIRL